MHSVTKILSKLEQLERLHSEDTPHRPVITHTMTSSYRIPSQKKVKAEKIRKVCEKIKILEFR